MYGMLGFTRLYSDGSGRLRNFIISLTPETGVRNPYGVPTKINELNCGLPQSFNFRGQ